MNEEHYLKFNCDETTETRFSMRIKPEDAERLQSLDPEAISEWILDQPEDYVTGFYCWERGKEYVMGIDDPKDVHIVFPDNKEASCKLSQEPNT